MSSYPACLPSSPGHRQGLAAEGPGQALSTCSTGDGRPGPEDRALATLVLRRSALRGVPERARVTDLESHEANATPSTALLFRHTGCSDALATAEALWSPAGRASAEDRPQSLCRHVQQAVHRHRSPANARLLLHPRVPAILRRLHIQGRHPMTRATAGMASEN